MGIELGKGRESVFADEVYSLLAIKNTPFMARIFSPIAAL